MKTALLRATALAALLALVPLAGAVAQVYNQNNATYIPTAVLATTTLKTTGDVYFQTQNTNAVSVQLLGSHGSLVAAVQGTNQGADVSNAAATWTALTMLPVPSGAGVASVTANGFWYVNASGMTRVRVHVSTMASGTLTVNVAGTTVPAGVTLLNPNTTSNPTYLTDSTSAYPWVVDSSGIGAVKVTNGTQSQPTGDALARSIFVKPGDGTSSVTIKAASTAAAAGDTSQVVALSPNVVDPCASPMVAKSSAVINVTSSSTTKIVDTSASTVIRVCNFAATLSGTTPSCSPAARTSAPIVTPGWQC
jgi:hypothetical protein